MKWANITFVLKRVHKGLKCVIFSKKIVYIRDLCKTQDNQDTHMKITRKKHRYMDKWSKSRISSK